MTGSGDSDGPGTELPSLPVYLDLPFGSFLAELGAGHAPPAAGCAAAACVALAASLCAMTARLSVRQLTTPLAGELTAEAERLRAQAAALIQADAEAVRQALSGGHGSASAEEPVTPSGTATAASAAMPPEATLVPMQVLETAVQIARLAARLAADGNKNLRGDAVCALLLADGGGRAAAALIQANLTGTPDTGAHFRRLSELLRESAALSAAVLPSSAQ